MNGLRTCIRRKNRALIPLAVCLKTFRHDYHKCRKCAGLKKGEDWPSPWKETIPPSPQKKDNGPLFKNSNQPAVVAGLLNNWTHATNALHYGNKALKEHHYDDIIAFIDQAIAALVYPSAGKEGGSA